jgi:peptidoglycan hydrolase CwlO-like protein
MELSQSTYEYLMNNISDHNRKLDEISKQVEKLEQLSNYPDHFENNKLREKIKRLIAELETYKSAIKQIRYLTGHDENE